MDPVLKSFCKHRGADLCGVADLKPFRSRSIVLPEDLLDTYKCAISIAIRLDNEIINRIADCPTPEYSQLCRISNATLDRIAKDITEWIDEKGFRAQAIPASLWIDTDSLLGNISHKAVARMAGIGWQGKSLLLVNEKYGSRIRLTTVLTDMPLEADKPSKNHCGKCSKCADACPAGAIRNVPTKEHYESRDAAIDLKRCYSKLLEFKEIPGIDYTFCGVCIRACPFGGKN
jgi:epoxyqueuosine reductase